jgi:hypothetical protein
LGQKKKRKEGEREVGRREPFWAEGRAGPRARLERRDGEKRGRGLGRSFLLFIFFSNSFFKLSKVLNSFKTFSSFKLFSKNFKSH